MSHKPGHNKEEMSAHEFDVKELEEEQAAKERNDTRIRLQDYSQYYDGNIDRNLYTDAAVRIAVRDNVLTQESTHHELLERYYKDVQFRFEMQSLMYRAGIMGNELPGNPVSPKYSKMFEDMLGHFGKSGENMVETFEAMAASEFGKTTITGSGSGRSAVPAKPRLNSEEDVLNLIDEVSRQEIGRSLTTSEIQVAKAIANRAIDKNAAQQQRQIDDVTAGRTSVNPTSMQTSVTNDIRETKKNEAQAYRFTNGISQLAQIVKGRI